MTWSPPNPALWQGRSDTLPLERYFQRISCAPLTTNSNFSYGLLGFVCDEGIRRNMGRLGAKNGPAAIRQTLAKIACHLPTAINFCDVGDIICDSDLENAQTQLANKITELLSLHIKPILLGGGHEIAYGHYLGLTKFQPNINIGIINFDAHLDMRPLLPNELGSSGTPFLQIANLCTNQKKPFHYLCLGLQLASNTASLLETASEHKVDIICADHIRLDMNSTIHKINHFMERVDAIYLTICLDVFAQAFAPGVSAPQVLGLLPTEVLPLLKLIANSNKLLSFDVAELSPSFDRDQQTANLAASLIDFILKELCL